MATKNANDSFMIATVENATNDVTDMLHRIRELAVQLQTTRIPLQIADIWWQRSTY